MITKTNISYLKPTKYVDCQHPQIKELSKKLTHSCKSEIKKIEKLFKWVKENIKFEFGYWGFKASEVLQRKTGMCTTKATLLIALLRATGIPAGYGILRVITKDFYGELMCPSFEKLVSPRTVHVFVGVYLNNKKLIICDPSVDKELANSLLKTNPFAQMTGFDLPSRTLKSIKGVVSVSKIFSNIDKRLDKPPYHAKGTTLKILNYYLTFLRSTKMALKCSSSRDLENHFLNWLRKEDFQCYAVLNEYVSTKK